MLVLAGLLGCKELGLDQPPPTQRGPSAELTDPTLPHWRVPQTGEVGNRSGEAAVGAAPTGERSSPLSQPVVYNVAPAAPPQVAQAAPVVANGGDRVMVNFVGADVHEVVSSILGDTLKINYSIDPKVTGTITFRTMSAIPRSDLLGVLEDMLALTNAAMVPRGGGYDIVPLDQAAKMPAILQGTSGRISFEPGFGIHTIPVRFASVDSLRAVVEPLLSPGRSLFVDQAHHLLIYVGTGSEAEDVADLVATLDVDPMAGKSFALFPVKYADPESVASELRMILVPAGSPANVIQIEPISRMNALLVITSSPAYLERARDWIDQLDHGDESSQRRLYVRYVQNGRAVELARVLRQAMGIAGTAGEGESAGAVAPGLPQTTMSATNPGLPAASVGEAPAATGPGLSTGGAAPGGFSNTPAGQAQATAPAYANDQTLNETGAAGDQGAGGAADQAANQLRIVSDARNNALVIFATPKEYELIDQALQRLDIVPLQVLIEATVAEVTLNDQLQYGVQWLFNSGDSTFTFSTLASGLVTPTFPGFNYVLSASSARVILNALTAITQVKVISSPELMVLDNGSARLQVGDQVPIVTQSAVSVVSPGAPIVNSVDYRDTGVILNISPRVSSNGLVILDVDQEVSDVVKTESSDIDSPTIQQRRVASEIAVNSGETIALGGLIRDRSENTVNGVPVLSNIPILGNLFKTTNNVHDRTELLVILSPKVIKNVSDARLATNELRQRLQGLDVLQKQMQ